MALIWSSVGFIVLENLWFMDLKYKRLWSRLLRKNCNVYDSYILVIRKENPSCINSKHWKL